MTGNIVGDTQAAAPSRAARHGIAVHAILCMLMAFASISTDLYLPALPVMATALRSSAGTMELTISSYLVGFSLGQLIWGPLGDRYGRRVPIAIGLVLFVFGSAACALADSAAAMIGWRVVQAVGACAGVVLGRAMVRDLYWGDRSAQMLSTLMTITGVAPLLGPSLGGQIMALSSWRAIFWTLVAIGLATLASLLALPETLPAERRNREPIGRALGAYFLLARQRRVIGYAGVGGFFYGGIYAYVAGSPFAYIAYYHVTNVVFGLLFAGGIAGIMAANMTNARLVMRLGSVRLMRLGTIGTALAGLVLAWDARTGWGGVAGLALPLFVYVAMNGFIAANSIAGALATYPERAGAVSALVGSVHYGTGILGSALLGIFADGTPWPMGWVIALGGLGSALCGWLIVPTPARD